MKVIDFWWSSWEPILMTWRWPQSKDLKPWSSSRSWPPIKKHSQRQQPRKGDVWKAWGTVVFLSWRTMDSHFLNVSNLIYIPNLPSMMQNLLLKIWVGKWSRGQTSWDLLRLFCLLKVHRWKVSHWIVLAWNGESRRKSPYCQRPNACWQWHTTENVSCGAFLWQ